MSFVLFINHCAFYICECFFENSGSVVVDQTTNAGTQYITSHYKRIIIEYDKVYKSHTLVGKIIEDFVFGTFCFLYTPEFDLGKQTHTWRRIMGRSFNGDTNAFEI